jgi:hypothetical protein
MTELLALALKLKEVNKKTSNIDEKVETLAINQKTTINDKMVAIFDEFKAEYQDFIKNIPLPTNGKDFDIKLWEKIENDINSLINSKISELDKQKADYIKQLDEKNANYQAFISEIEAKYNEFLTYFKEHFYSLKGENGIDGKDGQSGADGKDGNNGADGKDGKNGKDGVGIKDITEKNGDIIITLTDGTIKKLKMPRDIRVVTGGGGAKGGIDYAQLKSIEEPLLNNDEFMIFRDGKPYKVSLQSLSNYLGNDLPATAYTGTDGQGFTDLENNYYTSL